MRYLSLLLVCLCGWVGCSPKQKIATAEPVPVLSLRENGPASFQDWMHSPMRPANQEPITFSVKASAEGGIDKVELYVYEYELFKNQDELPSQRARTSGVWGKVRTYQFDDPQVGITSLSHTHGLGFGEYSRIEYIWRVTSMDGEVTDRFARFDAGTSPWPQDKVLLYSASRRSPSEIIDLGFFRDVDYKDDLDRFDTDVETMILEGFFGQSVISDNRRNWAFYTTNRSANGKRIAEDVTNDALIPEFLKDFSIPGIDAFCLVHLENYTDRSLLLENFHSLSNNLFSAEAHNWGTAVHECGHAIFHLSDEYGGCACFQTHSSSNVFRERTDCINWNVENGFPANDCYALLDLYERTWYSAEEPTFFKDEGSCRDFNVSQGFAADSCRYFIDEQGQELFWAFESTCIMHDDGDNRVRPFQRACRQVITDFYQRLERRSYDVAFAKTRFDNIYAYEEVVLVEMKRQDDLWNVRIGEATMGIPTPSSTQGGEIVMRVVDENGLTVADYRLAQPNAVHVHAEDHDGFEVPTTGSVRVSIPLNKSIARIICEVDADTHDRSADVNPVAYRDPFLFDVREEIAAARKKFGQ